MFAIRMLSFVFQVLPGEQQEFCIIIHLLYQVLPGEQQEFDELARNPACGKSNSKDIKKTYGKH